MESTKLFGEVALSKDENFNIEIYEVGTDRGYSKEESEDPIPRVIASVDMAYETKTTTKHYEEQFNAVDHSWRHEVFAEREKICVDVGNEIVKRLNGYEPLVEAIQLALRKVGMSTDTRFALEAALVKAGAR